MERADTEAEKMLFVYGVFPWGLFNYTGIHFLLFSK